MSEDEILKAIGEYLKSKGWYVAVIGGLRVQHQPEGLKLNYEFVVRFTGSMRDAELAPPQPPTTATEGK